MAAKLSKKSPPPKLRSFGFGTKGNADSKVTQLELHLNALFDRGINFRDRIITLSGDVDTDMFRFVDAALTELEAHSRKQITIRINSDGGQVYDALAIVGRIETCKCQVVTEGYGRIMSAATLILACGDRRKISKLAWFMAHEASYVVEGRHREVRAAVNQAEQEETQWATCLAGYSNESSEYWREVYANQDAYFTPEELLDMQVVDEII